MKTKFLILLPLLAALLGCAKQTSTDVTTTTTTTTTSTDDKPALDDRLYGTWYFHTTSMFNVNDTFIVNEDDTLKLGTYTFKYDGNYASFEEAFQFSFSTMIFIVSYDEEQDLVDFGFLYGDYSDIGTAKKTPYSQWEYIGPEWPINQVNNYLGTSGTLPVYESGYDYYLDLFTSSIYDCKSTEIEVHGTTSSKFQEYLNLLIDEHNFVFTNYTKGAQITSNIFYNGYDTEHNYSVRFFYDSDDNEAWLFIYKYNTKIAGEK